MRNSIAGSIVRGLTIFICSIPVVLGLALLIYFEAWIISAALEGDLFYDDVQKTLLEFTMGLLLLGLLALMGMVVIGLAMRRGDQAETRSRPGAVPWGVGLFARAQARYPATAPGIGALGKGVTYIGIPAIVLAIIGLTAPVADVVIHLYVAAFDPSNSEDLVKILNDLWFISASAFLGVIALAIGLRLERFSQRLRSRPAAALLDDPRAAITVYLRPFDTDSRQLRENTVIYGRGIAVRVANAFMRISRALDFIPGPGSGLRWLLLRLFGSRVEECIVDDLKQLGSVVAIGRPGEPLPELGASRLYARDEEWQARVLEMLHRANAVVLVAGESQGVKWELREVLSSVSLDRVALYLPYWAEKSDGKAHDLYTRFLEENAGLLPCEFPRKYERTMFLCFEFRAGQWHPRRIFAPNADSDWEAVVWATKQLVQHLKKAAVHPPSEQAPVFRAQPA